MGEDIRVLRLTSELVDLLTGYANSIRAGREWSRIGHTYQKEKRTARVLFSFLVEVWRFELQASSTRTAIFVFFDYQTLHIARIFRKFVSFCTLFPLFPYRTFPVVVSYVVKLKIRLKAENGELDKGFSSR